MQLKSLQISGLLLGGPLAEVGGGRTTVGLGIMTRQLEREV
jgi:hypothetical protein